MPSLHTMRKEIVEIGRRVYQRGYVAANDGNISARLDKNRILITPTGVSKGFMDPDRLAICDMDGNSLCPGLTPSSEIVMHIKVYSERPEINGIVHAHPPYSTAFGISGVPLGQAILPEVIMTLGKIPLIPYGTPGTDDLSNPLITFLKDHDAFILQNHGALTIGTDLMNAYFRMETLEHSAHITFISFLLGKMNTLSGPEVSKLLNVRSQWGFPGDFSPAICHDQQKECQILQPGQTYVTQNIKPDGVPENPGTVGLSVIQNIVESIIQEIKK